MDQNDKRNNSVPLGTFGQENQENPDSAEHPENRAREFVSAELEALAALQPEERLDPTIPRFRIDNTEVNPRPRVRTLLGVPAFDFPLDGRPEHENITASIADALDSDLRIDIDLDADPDAAEVTMVTDSDVVSLPDSVPPPAYPELIDIAPTLAPTLAAEPLAATQPLAAAQPARPAPAAQSPASVSPAALSSLAPREVQRPRPQPAKAQPSDSTSRVGLLLVAAALLLAAGGWLLTAGSFRRATITEAPAAPQTNQPMAVSQPLADTPQPSAAEATSASAAQPPSESAPSESAKPGPVGPELKITGTVGSAGSKKPSLTASSRSLRVKRTQPAPAATGDMPETPARGVVVQRLESVRSSVQACAAGRSGIADLDITIAHTGAVMHVLVGGDFAGTTQGSCIARAVREARFPTFKQEHFRLLYPYAI
jgi:hypothetical protein